MGLDMYLHAQKYVAPFEYAKTADGGKVSNADFGIITAVFGMDNYVDNENFGGIHVSYPVGYWRKANAIHAWFVSNVQNGEDNCGEYYVAREQLIELDSLCEQVLENHNLANSLLPSEDGFFFGSTEYDEWYFGSLQETREIIKKCLSIPENYNMDFKYQSSW